MERIDSTNTSAARRPKWNQVLMAVLIGVAVVQWTVGPAFNWLRPDATEGARFFVVKVVTCCCQMAVVSWKNMTRVQN